MPTMAQTNAHANAGAGDGDRRCLIRRGDGKHGGDRPERGGRGPPASGSARQPVRQRQMNEQYHGDQFDTGIHPAGPAPGRGRPAKAPGPIQSTLVACAPAKASTWCRAPAQGQASRRIRRDARRPARACRRQSRRRRACERAVAEGMTTNLIEPAERAGDDCGRNRDLDPKPQRRQARR